jgi:siroheme decarboxylase
LIELTERDISLLRELQKEMPVCERPFAEIAARAGMTEEEVVSKLREWLDSGIVRRFGAFIRHRKAGFTANGMAVWDLPEERVEEIGNKMSARESISHCYARPRTDKWPFRLYAMIHGKSREEVEKTAREISESENIDNYKILFSLRELKKSDTKLFMEKEI